MNILELPLDEFKASLQELEAQGVDTSELLRQYRAANSPFSGVYSYAKDRRERIADAGRTPIAGGLMSKLSGTTGMDAIRGLNLEPSAFASGLIEQLLRGSDAVSAAAQGLIPAEDMAGEAFGTAGVAMGGGGAMPKPKGALGMSSLRDAPNEPRSNQVLVRIPVKDVEHGESAMPGGRLTWPDAPKLVEEYAGRDTDLPPIEIMADEGGMAMIADGSHRFEAAKLRGQDYVDAYVDVDDLPELPSAEVFANASPTAGLLSQAGMSDQQAERTEQILQRMGLLD